MESQRELKGGPDGTVVGLCGDFIDDEIINSRLEICSYEMKVKKITRALKIEGHKDEKNR